MDFEDYIYSEEYQTYRRKYENRPLVFDLSAFSHYTKEDPFIKSELKRKANEILGKLSPDELNEECESIRCKMTNVGQELAENAYLEAINEIKFRDVNLFAVYDEFMMSL